MEQLPFLIAAMAVASVATYTDTRWTRIPNWLTFPALGIGLAMHGILGGPEALIPSLQGAGLGLLLFLVPFLIGGMGAGDVKLLTALGAFVGPERVFVIFFVSAVVGGVSGLLVLARRFGWQTAGLTAVGAWGGVISAPDPEARATTFPFASAIFLGLVAALLVH